MTRETFLNRGGRENGCDAKLHQFIGQMLSDLGGAASVALVRMGDALGLYKTLHARGPMTVSELAAAAGVNERYLLEWASHQAASNYLSYNPATRKFALPEEQAMVFAIDDSPVNMLAAFDGIVAWAANQEKVQPAFKNGGGVSWGDQTSCLFCAVARFFRPGYHNNLVSNWLPALDGVVDKLRRGAKVADVGGGHGWSTALMAKAFPNSQFIGYDFHPSSIEHARGHAREHGVTANTRFEVATAKNYPEKDFDLVAFFDCLHDMGDPGRRCPIRPRAPREQWRGHAGRTQRTRRSGHQYCREPPCRFDVLGLIGHLHPELSLPRGRIGTGRTSRRGTAARSVHRGWFHSVPPCR